MRITWLLLSLGFLCHSVCSQNTIMSLTSTLPTSTPNSSTSTHVKNSNPAPTSVSITEENTPPQTTAAPTTKKTVATDKTGASITPPPQTTSTITNKSLPTPSHHTASVFSTTVKNNAISRATVTIIPTTTAQQTTTEQKQNASGPNVTSRTDVPTSGNMGARSITKPRTNSPTAELSTSHTTITSSGKTGAARTEQTASGTPEPSRNPGTTGALPTVSITYYNMSTTTRTMALQPTPIAAAASTTTTTPRPPVTSSTDVKMQQFSLNSRHENDKDNDLVKVCNRLMMNFIEGNCTLTWREEKGKVKFISAEINGKGNTSLATQYYDEITKKATDNKTLIAILASCGALLIMIVILTVCASHHRKPYNENQQHLTEELHTVENGYHDNPTLEVMEVQPEMQEKKVTLNGEFNDSWIVPIDNLLKEEIPDEEDTHL